MKNGLLKRDEKTKAIINTDNDGYQMILDQRAKERQMQVMLYQIDHLNSQVASLQQDIQLLMKKVN